MKDLSTDDFIRRFAISIERRVRASDVLLLSKTGPHARAVKQTQREERQALVALNRHLKAVIKEHERQLTDLRREALAEMKAMDKDYRR